MPVEIVDHAPAHRVLGILLLDKHFSSSHAMFSDVIHIASQAISKGQLDAGMMLGIGKHGKPVVGRFHLDRLSIDGRPVLTADEQEVKVDGVFGSDKPYKLLFLPSAAHNGKEEIDFFLHKHRSVLPHLVRLWESGTIIAAGGSSVFLLAEAGLLKQRWVTTSWWLKEEFQKRYRDVNLDVASVFTQDERIFCAGSLESELHLSCGLIDTLGIGWMSGLINNVVLSSGMNAGAPARDDAEEAMVSDDSLVVRAQHWLSENLRKDVKLSELALHLSVSERTLIRHFKASLGTTPKAYLRQLRLEAASTMLESRSMTSHSVQRIAAHLGYQDVDYFAKIFREYSGLSPTEYRLKAIKRQ